MEQKILEIKENVQTAKNVYKLVLTGDIEEHFPGQFVNIKVPGVYLRRPVSVCDYKEGELTLCYKTVGEGTKILSGLKPNEKLDVLTALGNGYDLSCAKGRVLLAGGGMGCAPLYFLAEKLAQNNTSAEVVLGFNTENEIFCKDEFEALGLRTTIASADGSVGVKGFVTDALPQEYGYFYACGPLPMMKALNKAAKTSGQFSFEERMGCGFGVCMGCSLKVKDISNPDGSAVYKRICKEGPVFKREEIIWED